MKTKHIVIGVLLLVIPFVVVIGFGYLGSYFSKLTSRTYMVKYNIFSNLAAAIPTTVYILWLSFIMRTKNQKARVLFICCCLTIAVVLLFLSLGYYIVLFPIHLFFFYLPALMCGLVNLFAAGYMIYSAKKDRQAQE